MVREHVTAADAGIKATPGKGRIGFQEGALLIRGRSDADASFVIPRPAPVQADIDPHPVPEPGADCDTEHGKQRTDEKSSLTHRAPSGFKSMKYGMFARARHDRAG